MSAYSIQELKDALLEVLPDDRQPIPRAKARAWLCRYLGENVPQDRFNIVVDELARERRAIIGPGRGGTIGVAPDPILEGVSIAEESSLYAPFQRLIQNELLGLWQIGSQYVAEVTATQGRSKGRYRHPDLVLVARNHHKYLGIAQIQVYTFEVKTEKGCDATAVLEALSQRHRSHFGYVVWHVLDPDSYPDRTAQVRDYAERFGIGLILLRRIEPDASGVLQVVEHEVPIHAKRYDPDPIQVETLIENHLSGAGKTMLLGWHSIG